MSKSIQLTKEQEAEIHCVKHGHADYIWNCFGYVQCGRCGRQIGDRLAGIFDTTNKIWVGHKCETCDSLKKKLSPLDKQILRRLEKTEGSYDYEKILDGISFKQRTKKGKRSL